MKFYDLNDFEKDKLIDADICIVGSGPAGLTIAGEFANSGKKVWVLESGGLDIEAPTQSLYKYENVGVPRCIDQSLTRVRCYGGTSALWSGRVAPFGDIDFEKRDWVDNSGWPILKSDMEPYFERAGDILGLGDNCYNSSLWKQFGVENPTTKLNFDYLKSEFWQFSKSHNLTGEPTRFAKDFNPDYSDNINILLHANVLRVNVDQESRSIESVNISTLGGNIGTVKAKTIILCCGGVENARILLSSNHQYTKGLGNDNDMVGSCFMDHPYCSVGEFNIKESRKLLDFFGHYWLDDEKGRHVYLHGLSLSRDIQKKEKLLNCSVYLVTDEAIDASWLTAKRLIMSIKGRKFNTQIIKDFFQVVMQLDKILDGLFRRYIKNRPPILESNKIVLGCNVEQLPDMNSKITLSDKKDALGMPLARIDWKISNKERHTVIRMAEIINSQFESLGLPSLNKAKWLNNVNNWHSNFFDSAHHMGSTRMNKEPTKGVVDDNCKVHGIKGLYIGGGSIFPTAGTANPTLMIVSLALRLSDHLKS